jgi:hypothetical protein
MEPFSMHRHGCAQQALKFHFQRLSQSPRVDEPHPASIASTRLAVAGSARKCVAQVVLDSAGVTDGNHRKFAEDALNGNDVQDRFLVVKLVYHQRTGRVAQKS